VRSGKKKLRPVLDGPSWLIGDNPDLGELNDEGQECVDHHIFQSADGAWHLWGCIRGTAVGRLFYHWEAESLTDEHWRQTGQIIRADRDAGECLAEGDGKEWLQSPFVVQEGGTWYMFYGGHGTGEDERGNPLAPGDERTACQICLMTSPDGRNWTRHRDEEGRSRLFVGPGATRDPCLLKIDGLWHLYYAGYMDGDRTKAGYFLRTSEDLLHWSDWETVHLALEFGAGPWDTECPHVVERGGYYYLFRTRNYATADSMVFRSEDPRDFGIGSAAHKFVCRIAVAAPEVIVDGEGNEFISSNHDLKGGTRLFRLKWVEE